MSGYTFPDSAIDLKQVIANARALDLKGSAGQRRLSARHLTPKIAEILHRVAAFRSAVDDELEPRAIKARANRQPAEIYGDRDWSRYPIGFCRPIRDGVLQRMCADAFFQELIRRGLVLKPVFILLQGRYFQNAIQLGNLYLDAANDTVFPDKPKLDWAPIERVDFENLESWSRFAAVARRYLGITLYPNLVFPLAFPAAPFLAIRPNGRIEFLLVQHQIALKDIGDGMPRAVAVLDDIQLMRHRLPDIYHRILEREFGTNLFERFPLEFAPTGPTEMRDGVIRQFAELQSQPDATALPVVTRYFQLIEKAARILRECDLRPTPEELQRLRSQDRLPPTANDPTE